MALVLSRLRGDGVTIEVPQADGAAEKIHIFIDEVEGGRCKLAFTAARHITIIRDELAEIPAPKARAGGDRA